MRIIGIDFGTKRIGLAVGESTSPLVLPLRTIDAEPFDAAVDAVLAAAADESAALLVVGVPHRLAKGEGPAGETEILVAKFVEALKAKTDLAVDTEDERMTSALADRWREMAGTKKQNFDRDAAAAAAILETYVERRYGAGSSR
jgi:putative Holliday junction resolvase